MKIVRHVVIIHRKTCEFVSSLHDYFTEKKTDSLLSVQKVTGKTAGIIC